VYIHTEKRIPRDPTDPDAEPAAAAGAGPGGSSKGATYEYPMTALRRVAAEHIGKLVRVRVGDTGRQAVVVARLFTAGGWGGGAVVTW
jgi:hypothetical protein